MTLEEKLRQEYGDELLNYISVHYPRQFEYVVKTTAYYLKQDEQELQRNSADVQASELSGETSGQE